MLIADNLNLAFLFEAAVAGGIPIINTLKSILVANKVIKISGILNGTTNYILSNMLKNQVTFLDAFNEAKEKGYVELNPDLDIEGIDSAHKLSILSSLAFGCKLTKFDNIYREGISKIDIKEINFYIGAKQMMDLTYYAVVGQSTLHLIINKLDLDDTMVLKLYNPLSNNVQLGDDIYFTREVASHREFDLNLNDFTQPIIPDTILRLPSGTSVGEPIVRNRSTEYQNWDDL